MQIYCKVKKKRTVHKAKLYQMLYFVYSVRAWRKGDNICELGNNWAILNQAGLTRTSQKLDVTALVSGQHHSVAFQFSFNYKSCILFYCPCNLYKISEIYYI